MRTLLNHGIYASPLVAESATAKFRFTGRERPKVVAYYGQGPKPSSFF